MNFKYKYKYKLTQRMNKLDETSKEIYLITLLKYK